MCKITEKFAPPQYGDALADWLVQQYKKDPAFFAHARAKNKELQPR